MAAFPEKNRKFLVKCNLNGKTQVHEFTCSHVGVRGIFEFSCPVQLSSSSLQIRTHLAYTDNVKKSRYIKQQFTVLKARAS